MDLSPHELEQELKEKNLFLERIGKRIDKIHKKFKEKDDNSSIK